MKIGTYYYPDQWPRAQWERDFDKIASMGLQIVHMGEFAWHLMEPHEGDIRLDWLADCVEMARARKLDIILCTPTAAPPIWLARNHPETLPLDANGVPQRFGGRRHYSPTSPELHDATRRIVTALARRFAADPAVIGWQIDNELGGPFSQNPHTHRAFRQWLSEKYKTLDALNRAWGCPFWNTFYQDFEEILLPPSRNLDYANPHQRLDASRFWSWAFAQFTRLQAEILDGHFDPNRPKPFITTNFMPGFPDTNPRDFAGALTLFAWDSYPVSGNAPLGPGETHRLGDPAPIGFTHDQMASQTGRLALFEVQPGTVNWSGIPALVHPGAVRLWLWTAFAHGAELLTTYRFRQPLWGTELFHHGLIGPDGITPTPGGREFMQTIDEIKRLDLSKTDTPFPPDASKTVGLVVDYDQFFYFLTLPQARRWNYPTLLFRWHAAIERLGLRARILHPDDPIPADLPLVIAPALQMMTPDQIARLKTYLDTGGQLLLGPRTATMDRNGQLHEAPTAKPILDMIGGQIEAYDGLPDERVGQIDLDGTDHPWSVWGELLYAEPDTRILAKYADQFYAGAVAIMQKRHTVGLCTYCGVYPEQSLADALLERLAKQAGLPATVLPDRLRILQRGPYRIALNYNDHPVDVPAKSGVQFLVGARHLDPAAVAVWEE